MPHIAYVNGRYRQHRDATVHIEDRGYQFADGVYEVFALVDGGLVEEELHLERLDHSLTELKIAPPMSRPALTIMLKELVRRNGLRDGLLYLQVTRGVAPRDHKFPAQTKPSLVATLRRAKKLTEAQVAAGVAAISQPDQRWARCDIKSLSLLPNLLAKQAAGEAGAYEAILVDRDGFVTEGSSTNVWIVTPEGRLVTRKADRAILNGVTRRGLIAVLDRLGVVLEERSFTLAEAYGVREAIISSSSNFFLPVISIDGRQIGDGKAGPIAIEVRRAYLALRVAGDAP